MLLLFGSNKETLNQARAEQYHRRVANATAFVSPDKFPPTSDAAAQNSLRVYHQLQAWLGRELPPDQWGWEMTSIGYRPITMTCPAAPEKLLKIIKCSCQGYCDSAKCSCRKNGLKCSPACKNCKGVLCKNSEVVPELELSASNLDMEPPEHD